MSDTLISIITPCFNRKDMVPAAVESVRNQHDTDVEHILVDGGSTDGTLDVLRQYPHLRVTSGPDQGMYDAINKGMKMARGGIVGFLNTDDLYAAGCFAAVRALIRQRPETQAVAGGAILFADRDPGRQPLVTYPAIAADEFWYRILQGAPIFNAWFFRRETLERIGLFDPQSRTAADREYLIRAALLGIRPEPIPQTVYLYRQHSGSFTLTNLDSRSSYGLVRIRHLLESISILEKYSGHSALTPEAGRILRAAHSELAYQLAVTAVYHRQWRTAWQSWQRGWRLSPLFGLRFAGYALRRLGREWGRKLDEDHG